MQYSCVLVALLCCKGTCQTAHWFFLLYGFVQCKGNHYGKLKSVFQIPRLYVSGDEYFDKIFLSNFP